MHLRSVLVTLVLGGALLALTNPDRAEFADFVEEQARTRIADETAESGFEAALGELGGRAAGALVRQYGTRTDYLVASTYRLELGDARWRYLGVGGWFVPLEEPPSDSGPSGPGENDSGLNGSDANESGE